jgi:hypothetical protein
MSLKACACGESGWTISRDKYNFHYLVPEGKYDAIAVMKKEPELNPAPGL